MKHTWAFVSVVLAASLSMAQELNIKGSTTVQPAAEKWAQDFASTKPGVKVRVLGGGTGTGFQALAANTAQLGAASRKIEPKESDEISAKRGKPPVEFKVAIDGVAIFVNSQNRVAQLTMAQLADILTGKITNWSEVGGTNATITIYGRDPNSGTYGFLKDHLLKGGSFAGSAKTEPTSVQIIAQVGSDPGGIGYGSVEFAKGIRYLKIAADAKSPAVKPELASIRNGTYPLTRDLFFYSVGPPTGVVREFLHYVASEKGQAGLESIGLYALSTKDREKLSAATQ